VELGGRTGTALILSRRQKHSAGKVLLDNAYVLIEGTRPGTTLTLERNAHVLLALVRIRLASLL
jgi:hypothetical protein